MHILKFRLIFTLLALFPLQCLSGDMPTPLDGIAFISNQEELKLLPKNEVTTITEVADYKGKLICFKGLQLRAPASLVEEGESGPLYRLVFGTEIPRKIIYIWPNTKGYFDMVPEMNSEEMEFHTFMYSQWFDSKYDFHKYVINQTQNMAHSNPVDKSNFRLFNDLKVKRDLSWTHPASEISLWEIPAGKLIVYGNIETDPMGVTVNLYTSKFIHHRLLINGFSNKVLREVLSSIKIVKECT